MEFFQKESTCTSIEFSQLDSIWHVNSSILMNHPDFQKAYSRLKKIIEGTSSKKEKLLKQEALENFDSAVLVIALPMCYKLLANEENIENTTDKAAKKRWLKSPSTIPFICDVVMSHPPELFYFVMADKYIRQFFLLSFQLVTIMWGIAKIHPSTFPLMMADNTIKHRWLADSNGIFFICDIAMACLKNFLLIITDNTIVEKLLAYPEVILFIKDIVKAHNIFVQEADYKDVRNLLEMLIKKIGNVTVEYSESSILKL